MAVSVTEIAPGLWRWTARHPQWHATGWGAEVASFALRVRGDAVLLIDPLLPVDGGEQVERLLAELLAPPAHVHVYVTIPYHVRSGAEIAHRCGARRATVWGERRVARRLQPGVAVREPEPGAALPFGGTAFAIGRPRRAERPLWIEDHAALAFGDALRAALDARPWYHHG